MSTHIVLPIALVAVVIASVDAFATTKLTEQQVKNVCGKDLTEVGMSMGCTKKCGAKMCDYSCSKDASGKASNCSGFVVIRAPGSTVGNGVLPPGGLLNSGSAFGIQRPAAVGAPLGSSPAPAGPALR
jgi:hypothetical protein